MIKKLKSYITALLASFMFVMPIAVPATVVAQDTKEGLCQGVNLDPAAGCSEINAEDANEKINTTLKTVIDIFSLVVGVISVIMIIIGGLKYITSSGDTTQVTAAKNTIIYAVVGLVVVALAQFIVRFVISKV